MFGFNFKSNKTAEAVPAAPIKVAPEVKKNPKYAQRKPINAGRTDRLTADMPTTPESAQSYISKYQKIAVARARYVSLNNGYAARFKKLCRKNIIGANGIRLQAQVKNNKGKLDEVANDAIESSWKEWQERQNCDLSGEQCFRSFENMAIDSLVDNGEFMFLVVTGEEAGPMGFSLKQLDPCFCPSNFSSTTGVAGQSPPDSYIKNGIEFSGIGKKIAYWFFNNNRRDGIYTFGGRPMVRIPAEDILHDFERIMVGQVRGFPWLTSGLFNISNLGEINTSALVSVRSQATSAGFITSRYDDNFDPDQEVVVEQGQYNLIPADVDVTPPNIVMPDANYPNFIKENLREIAGGGDVNYNDLSNNLESVNYSSIRHGSLGERDGWEVRQGIVSEGFHEQIYRRWLALQLLRGQIVTPNGRPLSAAQLPRLRAHLWQARRWAWVDPAKEMNANAKAVDYMTKSISQVIREGGRDPQTVFQEWANDLDTFKKLGIPDEKINFLLSGGKTTNDGIIGEDEATGTSAGSDGE